MKRILTTFMVMTLLSTMATPAFGANADPEDVEEAIEDRDAGVRLLTEEAATVTRGTDVWIMLNWTAFGEVFDAVDDVEVRLRKKAPNGVTVGYPTNTNDHTSLWDNDTLTVGEVDYTALNVIVDPDFGKDEIKLKLELTFSVDGQRFNQRHNLVIPVVTFTGDPVEQVTHDWGTVTAGTAAWYEISFAGLAPAVTDFSVVVSEPGGVSVTYPQVDFTSLHFDDVLEARETDVVRIYLETAGVEPGQHTFDVTCTFTHDGTTVTEFDSVTLEITAP